MTWCQLHCLGVVLVSCEGIKAQSDNDVAGMKIPVMCRGSDVKRRSAMSAFQLESLILAQNERWRQA